MPIICGPMGYLNMMPLEKGRVFTITVVYRGDTSAEGIKKQLHPSVWEDYDPGVLKMIELIREGPGDFVTWTLQDHDPAPIYHRNNVVMVGDAAHATMPFIGNGAAQALEDSAVLYHVLSLAKRRERTSSWRFKRLRMSGRSEARRWSRR